LGVRASPGELRARARSRIALALLARRDAGSNEPPRLRDARALAGALISLAVSFRAQHVLGRRARRGVGALGGRSVRAGAASRATSRRASPGPPVLLADRVSAGLLERDAARRRAGEAPATRAGHEARPPKLGAVIWACAPTST
jgi:hypothetical protein